MQQDFASTLGIHEMLGEALDSATPLAQPLRRAIGPLADQRSMLREALGQAEAIKQLPDDSTYLSLAAVDGAYTVTPLFIGDQINVLAIAVRSDLKTGDVDIQGYRTENEFLPHSPINELHAKATMLTAELQLLHSAVGEDVLTVVDGSHTTAATAIAEALIHEGSLAHDRICDDVMSDQIISALEVLSGQESVVACPKSDSSTEISDFVEQQGVPVPMRLPDKVLASLVLEPGEVLALGESQAPWGRYDVISQQIASHQGRAVRARIDQACAGLHEGLRVAHVKPVGSATAIRVETKASVNDFETLDYWQALAEDCAPPHTQEPVAQYIADHLAKNVSELSKVQLDTARLDLAESADDGLLEFMVRTYRTS